MLGFHDKTIEFEDQNKLDSAIASLLQEIKPSLVFTFYPGYSVHPDHDATGAAVIRTIQRMPAGDRPVVQCLAFSNNCEQELGKPDVYQDVSMFMVQKLNSIQAHRSQFQAAELLGKKQMKAKEVEQRFGTERFWTYTFE